MNILKVKKCYQPIKTDSWYKLNLLIIYLFFLSYEKAFEKKKKLLKSMEKKQAKVNKHQGEKQFQALQPLMFFEKELLFVTDYISN